jgi:hypothetical protein
LRCGENNAIGVPGASLGAGALRGFPDVPMSEAGRRTVGPARFA